MKKKSYLFLNVYLFFNFSSFFSSSQMKGEIEEGYPLIDIETQKLTVDKWRICDPFTRHIYVEKLVNGIELMGLKSFEYLEILGTILDPNESIESRIPMIEEFSRDYAEYLKNNKEIDKEKCLLNEDNIKRPWIYRLNLSRLFYNFSRNFRAQKLIGTIVRSLILDDLLGSSVTKWFSFSSFSTELSQELHKRFIITDSIIAESVKKENDNNNSDISYTIKSLQNSSHIFKSINTMVESMGIYYINPLQEQTAESLCIICCQYLPFCKIIKDISEKSTKTKVYILLSITETIKLLSNRLDKLSSLSFYNPNEDKEEMITEVNNTLEFEDHREEMIFSFDKETKIGENNRISKRPQKYKVIKRSEKPKTNTIKVNCIFITNKSFRYYITETSQVSTSFYTVNDFIEFFEQEGDVGQTHLKDRKQLIELSELVKCFIK